MGLYNLKTYDFPTYAHEPFEEAYLPFAVAEYLSNTLRQILRTLEVQIWREWRRTDLSRDTVETHEQRKETKANLMNQFPCMFAGEQGRAIAELDMCQPSYVLSATIPYSEIKDSVRNHNLHAVIVLWKFCNGPTALTVYNNYLDQAADLSHFLCSERSNAGNSQGDAVPKPGRGFKNATLFFAHTCHSSFLGLEAAAGEGRADINDIYKQQLGTKVEPQLFGVGFNVGSEFARCHRLRNRRNLVRVKVEDLRALTVDEFRTENPLRKEDQSDCENDCKGNAEQAPPHGTEVDDFDSDGWYLDKLRRTYRKRAFLHISKMCSDFPLVTDPTHEVPLVRNDDVCIHVIGLPDDLTADKAFSAMFGVLSTTKTWCMPGLSGLHATEQRPLFEFFEGDAELYHRDRLLRAKSPLKNLSMNYYGSLDLDPFHIDLRSNTPSFHTHFRELLNALDVAICTIPELATQAMRGILEASPAVVRKFAQQLVRVKGEQTEHIGNAYKEAFQKAGLALTSNLMDAKYTEADSTKFYPCTDWEEESELVRELGFCPIAVGRYHLMLLVKRQAFVPIRAYAKELLYKSSEDPADEVPGLDLFTRCLKQLLEEAGEPSDVGVEVSQYDGAHHLSPKIWYARSSELEDVISVLARPPKTCRMCLLGCSCWVVPYLIEAVEEYEPPMYYAGPVVVPKVRDVFRVYAEQVGLEDIQDIFSRFIVKEKSETWSETDPRGCIVPFPEDFPLPEEYPKPMRWPRKLYERQDGEGKVHPIGAFKCEHHLAECEVKYSVGHTSRTRLEACDCVIANDNLSVKHEVVHPSIIRDVTRLKANAGVVTKTFTDVTLSLLEEKDCYHANRRLAKMRLRIHSLKQVSVQLESVTDAYVGELRRCQGGVRELHETATREIETAGGGNDNAKSPLDDVPAAKESSREGDTQTEWMRKATEATKMLQQRNYTGTK